VAGSEILRASKAFAEGTASARMLRTLGESGIEPHMRERIAKAFETGGEVRDGVHLPNTADWTDKEARRVFEGAVARDVDISVVTPGQEKPLWMSQQVVNAMGQFKSFTAAANERIVIANLQRRDAQVLQGIMFSMGLGMLSYKIGSLTGGQPASDKPQDWIKEAISKGNLLGWFEEANALASKATRGGLDVYRIIGADKPLSRFASRSAMDQLLGPTAGKIQGILSVVSGASRPSEWSEADSKALRRLVAGQNVFYLRGLFNQVEAAGNNAAGIEMKAKPENR
jgi:sulfite reductase beta subunit-like hemoprotein